MEQFSLCAVRYGCCSQGAEFFTSFNLQFFHLSSHMWLVVVVSNSADLDQNSLLSGV